MIIFFFNNMRLSCDSIGNAYFYEKFLQSEERKKYIQLMNTIGGKIIFPKDKKPTINQKRGIDSSIKDRFDLTLECIKLYYRNIKSPLYENLVENKEYFDLFGSFNNYVKFFFLDDCLVDSDGNVKFFISENFENPIPESDLKKQQLYLKTIKFLERRNLKIKEFVTNL